MVERFKRTFCDALEKHVPVIERDWHDHVLMTRYRFNTIVQEATGMISFKAMSGVEAFELNQESVLCDRIDEDRGSGKQTESLL